ncbi:DEAD/DEAH box helicase [Acetobacterium wieringae]|uniref:DEAD/DEAH box helicase n=1 Tax=Acetobacterium wieringae TaxID=52694 RepID=A0A5D0WWA7_9FIRM|nr:DEAD/DEAH box helicase family protein [Acetobacterium wieringae]TYC88534.1 DEAD/DEAH box helicase [Acetobacterium wieringae]
MNTFDSAATIQVRKGKNPRSLYEHQAEAMLKMNKINQNNEFSSLLVLPTGGGKTLTAVSWLMKNATDKGKKVLWIAHRHLLLEQAADAFIKNACSDNMINCSTFKYRVISGKHDKPIHIRKEDDILIVSKDSIIRNLKKIKSWIENEDELYLIIDEAHHATAKSYRKIIEFIRENISNVKLLGLTATPFRTASEEEGLLKKIFTDDIVYKIDLTDLIKKEILSRPIFEECDTNIEMGDHLGLNDLKSIEYLDNLPEDVAKQIAENKTRNKLIVSQYVNNKEKYGQTLVFAINRLHAIVLKGLFEKEGVKAGFIVTGTSAEFIGIDVSNEENSRNIEAYRKKEINVLINVNILTEGVDLPETKTVFLARPTVSSILMTQMIGRALRGIKAGGTAEAYIVSFIDDWNDKIAWVNPESLIEDEGEFQEKESQNMQNHMTRISIAKIEEFAKIIDTTVDTRELEAVDFIKRVPLGMYTLSFLDKGFQDDETMERNHQVLVYDSTKNNYVEMIEALPALFDEFQIQDEFLDEKVLNKLCEACRETYFIEKMLPSYDKRDIRNILKYFAQKECTPNFIKFEDLDRKKLDISVIAQTVHSLDLKRSEEKTYIDQLWDEREDLKIYYNKKLFFFRQLTIEMEKLDGLYEEPGDVIIIPEEKKIEELSLQEMRKSYLNEAKSISDTVYKRYADENGGYYCASCGKKSKYKGVFQIDHILPMSKGGLTKLDNLQLLCRTCNMKKSDHIL